MTEQERFGDLIDRYLLPLFPRSVKAEVDAKNSAVKAAFMREHASNAVRLQLRRNADHAFKISRSQEFQKIEKQTMEAFVEVTEQILPLMTDGFGETLLKTQMDIVVAKTVTTVVGRSEDWKLLAELFSVYQKWSQETYEGHRVATALGLNDSSPVKADGMKMSAYLELNMAKVVGDGFSTLCTVHTDGSLGGHEYLPSVLESDETFAPFAFIPFAKWATEKKIAVALNRGGEILVFANQQLCFARRRGTWLPFCHEAAVSQLSISNAFSQELRKAAYLSALDISFSRVGGGIGLVRLGKDVVGEGKPVQERDRLSALRSPKIRALKSLIGERKYQELGRPLRKEIGGIDGAVVLKHTGEIITAGAVLAVKISNDEGARRTASKTLAASGIGIKISSDGKIEAYSGDPTPEQKPLFEIG
jgi:hypothetical protein